MAHTDEKAFIFIPDISGFSKFIAESEIVQSQLIIAELLEVIIDSNELGFKVSEIEGDAVLFYRFGPPPSREEIIEQSRKTFAAFHKHLFGFFQNKISMCEASQTAHNLTLKIIGTYGNLSTIKIKQHEKLIGKELITAHRLLKNDIPTPEYLLLTDSFLAATAESDAYQLNEGRCTYEDVGEIGFCWYDLSPLLEEMTISAAQRELPDRLKECVGTTYYFDAPLRQVHEALTDFEEKRRWNSRINKIEYDRSKVIRNGMVHTCYVANQVLDIESYQQRMADDSIEYIEKVKSGSFLTPMHVFWRMSEQNGGTELELEITFTPKNIFQRWGFRLMKGMLLADFGKSIEELRLYLKGSSDLSGVMVA